MNKILGKRGRPKKDPRMIKVFGRHYAADPFRWRAKLAGIKPTIDVVYSDDGLVRIFGLPYLPSAFGITKDEN